MAVADSLCYVCMGRAGYLPCRFVTVSFHHQGHLMWYTHAHAHFYFGEEDMEA